MTGMVMAVALEGPLADEISAPLRVVTAERGSAPGRVLTEYRSPRVYAGCVGLDGSSAVVEQGDTVTVVFGEVVARGLTVGVDGATGARRLAQNAAERGPEALTGLNGHYAVVHWNAATGALHGITDRLAGINLYVWEAHGTVVFATRLTDITAVPGFDGVADEQGFVDVLTVGGCLDGRTLFRSVKRIEWASHWSWADGARERRRYWTPQFEGGEPTRPLDAYADDLAALVREQVAMRADHRLVVPLSGGFDSRVLTAAAAECVPADRLATYTLGDGGSYDGRFGPAVARSLGLSHSLLPIPATYYRDHAEAAVRLVDGMVIGHTCWRMAGDPFLKAHPGWVVLNGWAGEQFQDFDSVRGVDVTAPPARQFDQMYREFAEWRVIEDSDLKRLLRPPVYAATEGVARGVLHDAYVNAPADNPRQRVDFVTWTVMSPRKYQRMNRDYGEVHCRVHQPFRENAMADFLQRLPPATRCKGGVYGRMVARHWPRVARVPSSHGGVPIAGAGGVRALHRAMGWLQFKAVPALTGGRVRFPNPGTYVHYLDWLRGPNRSFVESVLSGGEYLEDLFDMDGVRAMVGEVMDGRSTDYGKVYNLTSLALFRRYAAERGAPVTS